MCRFTATFALDFAIELKEKQPQVFHDLMTDYEFSSRSLPH